MSRLGPVWCLGLLWPWASLGRSRSFPFSNLLTQRQLNHAHPAPQVCTLPRSQRSIDARELSSPDLGSYRGILVRVDHAQGARAGQDSGASRSVRANALAINPVSVFVDTMDNWCYTFNLCPDSATPHLCVADAVTRIARTRVPAPQNRRNGT